MTVFEPCRVLQLCHGYDGPFMDCARQYAALFIGKPYKVTTVFLTGAPDPLVEKECASDEVIFLNYSSKDISGLKLKVIHKVRALVRSSNFQFCIAHRFKPTYIACLATQLPVIGVNHAFGVYQRRSRQLFAHLFRKRLNLLGVSNAVREDLRRCLAGWPAERIETLYNRIDVAAVQAEQVDRDAARDFLGLPRDAWVVGNVGRLHPDKDQATLIRGFALALHEMPADSLLAIMGSGRLEQPLKRLAESLGVAGKVRFLGQIPQGRRYFKAFDAFVLTSDREAFGMVLLEAMAAGVPLICSDCGGGSEVVEGVGQLFAFGDVATLAREIRHCAEHLGAPQVSKRLTQRFSDEAAREAFWRLPLISAIPHE